MNPDSYNYQNTPSLHIILPNKQLQDGGGLKTIRTKSQIFAERCIAFQPVSLRVSKAIFTSSYSMRPAEL
jgi:hypothetical protein